MHLFCIEYRVENCVLHKVTTTQHFFSVLVESGHSIREFFRFNTTAHSHKWNWSCLMAAI